MGLFDSFSFNPAAYQGAGGVLGQLIPQALWGLDEPKQDQPTSYGNYGGIQYPIFGTPPQPPQQADIPQSAAPVQYQPQPTTQGDYGGVSYPMPGQQAAIGNSPQAMPQAPQQQAVPQMPAVLGGQNSGAGFGDRLMAGLGGFANSEGLLPALSNLISGVATGQRTDPTGQKQQMLRAQYEATRQALIGNGWSPAQAASTAMLSVFSPEAAKTILPEALSNKEEFKTMKDALGGEHGYWVNPRTQTVRPADNDGGAPGGGVGTIGQPQVLAPGVKGYNANLTGDAYLNQFSPEVKSFVNAYLNGDVMPTGNPRMQGMANFAKTIALKYAQDMGIPSGDAIYAAKRKMQTDIASSGNSSIGGILSNGKSAFEHLKTYSEKLADVGNVSHDFVGGGMIANAQNAMGNAFGSSEQKGKVVAANNAGLKYGQESTKFYAGSGGGVEERMAALHANDATKASGQEMAGFLQAERDLMLGRLQEKEKQVREVMGDKWVEQHPIITPELKKTIDEIDANIARLKGKKPDAAAGGAPTAGLPSGWTVRVK